MVWAEVFKVEVSAKPQGLWTLVAEYVCGPVLVKIEAAPDGQWNYSETGACTADGDLLSLISPQTCLLRGAPVGALIAKICGSTAGTSDGTMFLVGRSCIYEVDQTKRGPLYLTINDELTGMANNHGKLAVTVSIKFNQERAALEPKPAEPTKPAEPKK
jgi:hypothetical protein